jgi:putative flippase GtrA
MSSKILLARLTKLARYLLGGGGATLLHWGTMAFLVSMGGSPNTATAIGALFGATANYLLQFHFTFRSPQPHLETMPRYVLITLLSWCANNALFAGIHGFTSWSVAQSQLFTTICVTVLNFTLYQRYVFHERDRIPPP